MPTSNKTFPFPKTLNNNSLIPRIYSVLFLCQSPIPYSFYRFEQHCVFAVPREPAIAQPGLGGLGPAGTVGHLSRKSTNVQLDRGTYFHGKIENIRI